MSRHDDTTIACQTSPTLEPLGLVLTKEELDALGERGDALVLLLHHLSEVERGQDLDPQLGELGPCCGRVKFRSVKKRLGGHATHIEASAAERGRAFYAGNFQSQLAGPDGSVIASGSATNYHNVILAHFSPRVVFGNLN